MALTTTVDVANEMEKYWSPLTFDQLVQDNALIGLVNSEYEGQLGNAGDTVYVSVVSPLSASQQTIGVDADTFDSQKIVTTRTSLVCDQVFSSSIEVTSWAELQSLVKPSSDSRFRDLMTRAIADKMNTWLFSKVKSANDLSSKSTITTSEFRDARVFAGQKKWPKDGNWYGLLDPTFWGDCLVDATLSSSLFTGDMPISTNVQFRNILGFKCAEENSLSADHALFFHKDWLYLAIQQRPTFKVSDLHSQKKRGYLVTCDVVAGAVKNAYAGDNMHFKVVNASW